MRKWPKCVSRKRRNGLVRTTTAVLAAVCVGSCVYLTDPVSLIVSQNLSFFSHTHTLSLACRGKIGREYLWRETFADKRLAKPQGGRLRRTWCTVPSIDWEGRNRERTMLQVSCGRPTGDSTLLLVAGTDLATR